jgi:hypothetical protein
VSKNRKWLKVFVFLVMGVASGVGAVNPKEISEMIHIMNEQKIEFSIPDDSDDGDDEGKTAGRMPALRSSCAFGTTKY